MERNNYKMFIRDWAVFILSCLQFLNSVGKRLELLDLINYGFRSCKNVTGVLSSKVE